MSNSRASLLLRVCFFGGVVLLVGLSILQSILSEASQDYIPLSLWVVSGIIASAVPLLISIARLMGIRTQLFGSASAKYRTAWLLANGMILALLVVVLASVVTATLFGEAAFETFILKNSSLGIVVFPTALALSHLFSEH